MNITQLKDSIIEVCHLTHGLNILKTVDGRRDYKEIAEILHIHPTTCSHILKKAETFGLLTKPGGVYRKTDELKHVNIKKVLRESNADVEKDTTVTVRKRKKVTDYGQIKKIITDYINYHFNEIQHPFNEKVARTIEKSELDHALELFFKVIESDVSKQLKGLHDRFYDAFSTYFSSNRINKTEFTNSFSVLIKCYEPYLKKMAAYKTGDASTSNMSLNKELIRKLIRFDSNINNANSKYWQDKAIHEACLRVIFPYRHIEAHEARDYTLFQMERITYYMFASIIFINIEP